MKDLTLWIASALIISAFILGFALLYVLTRDQRPFELYMIESLTILNAVLLFYHILKTKVKP